LYVGSRLSYKNFSWMLNAIASFLKKERTHLLCIGGGSFTIQERQMINSLKLNNLVTQKTVSRKKLEMHYTKAKALVYPSLYEGFGLPILEALQARCLVISSNKSSLPEVGGKHVLYFDPNNKKDLLAKLNTIKKNRTNTKIKLLKNIEQHLEKFSWKNTSLKTSDVYFSLFNCRE
jgi:glycosyltransferase involved in cell wall biosynthesis